MRLKVPPQNRYNPQQQPPIEISVTKKQGNEEQIIRHEQMKQNQEENISLDKGKKGQVIISESQKQKALKFREKQLADDLIARRMKFKQSKQQKGGVMNNFDEAQNNENFNDIMNKISAMELPRDFKEELVSKSIINLSENL